MPSPGFVMQLYKAAGLFEGLEINGNEFTAKDIYQLKIWNENFERPAACKEADPHLKYCQLFGEFRITMPGYNSVAPYSHMNERCPSQPIDYFRPDNC